MKNARWAASVVTLLLALLVGITVAQAQDRDQGQDRDHHDQDRDHHDHDHFDDRDRGAARDWYRDHHGNFHHDEGRYWRRDWEPQIHEGFVLTPDMRAAIRPVPRDLYGRFGPPPPGYRYVVIGDHVCLIDRGYRIHDVLHFELNF